MGSIHAMMMFREDIQINRRQCRLLVDAFELAFERIRFEILHHLRYQERLTKWKALEQPLCELYKIFKKGESYIRQCHDAKDWWTRALSLAHLTDCVEVYVHNLLWCISVMLEAVESISEVGDHEEALKKKLVFTKKCEHDWMESKLFEHKFGHLCLVSNKIFKRVDTTWKEEYMLFRRVVLQASELYCFWFEIQNHSVMMLKSRPESDPLLPATNKIDAEIWVVWLEKKPGGLRSIPYILCNEVFVRLAMFRLTMNLMLYLVERYEMGHVAAMEVVFIFHSTTNLASLFGAFIADTHWGQF